MPLRSTRPPLATMVRPFTDFVIVRTTQQIAGEATDDGADELFAFATRTQLTGEEALDAAQKINMPGFWVTHVNLARAYGQLGRQAEAAKSIEKLLELYPDYPDHARMRLRKWNWPEAAIEQSIEGLRKAGLDIPDEDAAAN